MTSDKYVRHGMSGSRINRIWRMMRQRCNNPNTTGYQWYGGKGISVCKEWDSSFTAFMEWSMANGYEDHLTIERRDSTKDYEPSNCEWITREENTRRAIKGNKKESNTFTYKGETKTLPEWSVYLGINYKTLNKRLKKNNNIDEVFSTPARAKKGTELVTYNGKTQTISAWATETGIAESTLRLRLNVLKWSVGESLTKEVASRKKKH